MKKIRKIIFAFLILATVSTPFFAFLNVDAEEIQRGTLRCPTTLDNGVRCVTHTNAQGEVTSVDIIYGKVEKKGDIQIIKTVTKNTTTVGTYSVQFQVKGDVDQLRVSEPAYVSVIIDMSYTVSRYEGAIIEAVQNFARKYIPNNNGSSNFFLSLDQFATYNYSRRGLDNKNFDDTGFIRYKDVDRDGYRDSQVGKALENVYNKLSKKVDGKKYVVIFGDGYYWYSGDTDIGKFQTYSDKLRNEQKAKIFFIRYPSREDGEKSLWKSEANHASCYKEYKWQCNERCARRILVGDYGPAAGKKYTLPNTYFNHTQGWSNILNTIGASIEDETTSSVISELTDNKGKDFFFTESTGNYKNFNVGEITKTGWTSDSFNIEIDRYTNQGWHETNNSFNLTYVDKDGKEQIITVDTNPEVYWIPDKTNTPACSGPAIASGIRRDTGDPWNLYSTSCIEGYDNTHSLQADFYVKDIPEGIMSDAAKKYINVLQSKNDEPIQDGHFTIASGLGIPAYVKLKTAVRCSYVFNYNEFTNRYENFKRGATLALPTYDPNDSKSVEKYNDTIKEKLSAYKNLQKLMTYVGQAVSDYSDITNSMVAYGDRFVNQPATLTVTYTNNEYTPNKTVPDTVNLTNIPGTISKPTSPSCSGSNNQTVSINVPQITIEGESLPSLVKTATIPLNRVCTIAYSKEMSLENSCLNMTTGEQETCVTDSNKQIIGGSKFYTKMQEDHGIITINIPGLGMNENVDVSLSADEAAKETKCTFESTKKLTDIMYRQIDLDDPFLESYDPSRGVGENYSSHGQYKYNFENIIKPETWRQTSDYYYSMSKEDIQTIRKDTNEEGKKSYLGRNCYFRDNSNKFVCEFTRDRSMFYDSNIDNDKK